jgi:hypothetical protein
MSLCYAFIEVFFAGISQYSIPLKFIVEKVLFSVFGQMILFVAGKAVRGV